MQESEDISTSMFTHFSGNSGPLDPCRCTTQESTDRILSHEIQIKSKIHITTTADCFKCCQYYTRKEKDTWTKNETE